ncbi:MAG: short-chain dehydrogenase [Gammaproteobacteria bacterium]|nr:short-chain dehydrogenase [Gammaproteobacteria bacterium]
MEVRMDDRVALITGASKGLGYAMAMRFAKSGAMVALISRNEDEVVHAANSVAEETSMKCKGYACDVSKAMDIEETFSQVVAEFGKVDILINNAGHAKVGSIESITDDEWQYDLDLKLMAAVRLSRLVFPGMKERKWGRIINMLNTMAKTPIAGSAPTSVTRAAGMALTKVLAGEGAPHNILVNGFNIGRIKSDQIQRAYDHSGSELSFDEFVADAGKSIPLGRFGEAEECANLACLLCSDAGGYVTGTAINVDGNLSAAL